MHSDDILDDIRREKQDVVARRALALQRLQAAEEDVERAAKAKEAADRALQKATRDREQAHRRARKGRSAQADGPDAEAASDAEYRQLKAESLQADREFRRLKNILRHAKSDYRRVRSESRNLRSRFRQRSNDLVDQREARRERALDQAGLEGEDRDNSAVIEKPNGTTQIYLGADSSTPYGPGHGHIVLDSSGRKIYDRGVGEPHGRQNFIFADEPAASGDPAPSPSNGGPIPPGDLAPSPPDGTDTPAAGFPAAIPAPPAADSPQPPASA